MNATIQQIYGSLKILDEANEGIQYGISRVEVEKAAMAEKETQLTAVLDGKDVSEVERLKADLELSNIKKVRYDLEKTISSLREASIVLINLKTFITSVNTVENGNIVIPPDAFTCFVMEGINRYSTYDFEKRIAAILEGNTKSGVEVVVDTSLGDNDIFD